MSIYDGSSDDRTEDVMRKAEEQLRELEAQYRKDDNDKYKKVISQPGEGVSEVQQNADREERQKKAHSSALKNQGELTDKELGALLKQYGTTEDRMDSARSKSSDTSISASTPRETHGDTDLDQISQLHSEIEDLKKSKNPYEDISANQKNMETVINIIDTDELKKHYNSREKLYNFVGTVEIIQAGTLGLNEAINHHKETLSPEQHKELVQNQMNLEEGKEIIFDKSMGKEKEPLVERQNAIEQKDTRESADQKELESTREVLKDTINKYEQSELKAQKLQEQLNEKVKGNISKFKRFKTYMKQQIMRVPGAKTLAKKVESARKWMFKNSGRGA